MYSNSTSISNSIASAKAENTRIEEAIVVFFVTFFAANAALTLLGLSFLLKRRPYPKKVLSWFVLQACADCALCCSSAFLVILSRRTSVPRFARTPIFAFLADFDSLDAGAWLKCRLQRFALHLPLFVSPMSLAFSSTCRCLSIAQPLRSRRWLTPRVNLLLLCSCLLLAALLAAADSVGYVLFEFPSSSLGVRCCKFAPAGGSCRPSGVADSFWRTLARNCRMVSMFLLYSVCLLASIFLVLSLLRAKRLREDMTDGGEAARKKSKKSATAERRVTATLAALSCLQFACCMPGELAAAGAIPALEHSNHLRQGLAKIYEVTRIKNALWDMTKVNNAVNWLFYIGASRQLYQFYLPCLFGRLSASDQVSATRSRTDG